MERRDRAAHLRQQSAGHVVPRAIGGEVDERDIIEMMERRAIAETNDDAQEAGEGGSGKAALAEGAAGSGETIHAADAAAAADGDDAAAAGNGSGSSEGTGEDSEEEDESKGSWSDEEGEGEGDDSDIEEFYLKGGEGQMDAVEKKRAAAAEHKLVQVPAHAPTHNCPPIN